MTEDAALEVEDELKRFMPPWFNLSISRSDTDVILGRLAKETARQAVRLDKLETTHPGDGVDCRVATIFLTGQRKATWWNDDDLDGWIEVAWERFEYIECAVYRKQKDDMDKHDTELHEEHGKPDEGWIRPALYPGLPGWASEPSPFVIS